MMNWQVALQINWYLYEF